jgi:hypothetical protein
MAAHKILGVIADDFTGATDVASMLVRAGHAHGAGDRCAAGRHPPEVASADAVVVALKSPHHAGRRGGGRQSLAALRWLQAAGARQIYFKYCSTFDSTPAGNIGPVAEALMEALGTTSDPRLPGLPRERPHRVPRPPVRGRRAAVRFRHAPPPADADDRQQPGARAAGAVPARWGCCGTTWWPRAPRPSRARLAALQRRRRGLWWPMRSTNDDLRQLGAGAAAPAAGGWPVRAWRWACRVLAGRGWVTLNAHASGSAALTGTAAVLAGSCSLPPRARWPAGSPPAGRRCASTRWPWPAGSRWRLKRWPGPRPQSSGPVLSMPPPTPPRWPAVQAALGVAEAGALVEHHGRHRPRPGGRGRAAAPGGGRRRDLGRGGAGAGRAHPAHRRAIDPGVPWTQAQCAAPDEACHEAGAEVRQLRHRRSSSPKPWQSA